METNKTLNDKKVNIHQELIEACKQYDRTAQVRIYELYYKAMYNTSYRILNNTAEAEDAMQEAFLEAFRRIGTYREEAAFGAWLRRIVINKSLDALKRKKEMFLHDPDEADIVDDTQSEREEKELTEAKVGEIRNAMEKIPGQYRVILSLYLLEGYDHKEIADILSISYNNVRVRYMRAKSSLLAQIVQTKKTYLDSIKN